MERGRHCAVVGLRVLHEGVVLVGLHYSLACACGAAVGPFVLDYETERQFLCCVVRVGYWRHEPVVRSRVVASFLFDSCLASGCGLTYCGVLGRRHSCTDALWWHLVVVGLTIGMAGEDIVGDLDHQQ
ncbi:hypothetical protein Taro_041197 [Colocasia esculenta]|uniref:Uncharacterized protein n=1 Tax=Colocasia esculenta TaxID=4460 RepID=A0A843WDR0_COLES|nr:hypothetical protein [Colocasia esculenta]